MNRPLLRVLCAEHPKRTVGKLEVGPEGLRWVQEAHVIPASIITVTREGEQHEGVDIASAERFPAWCRDCRRAYFIDGDAVRRERGVRLLRPDGVLQSPVTEEAPRP